MFVVASASDWLVPMLAFCGAALPVLAQTYIFRQKESADSRQRRADYVIRQLSEVHGPLRLLVAQSGRLAKQLRSAKPPGWNLLSNLEQVVSYEDQTDFLIAEQLMEINSEVERLLLEHAGLLEKHAVGLEACEDFLGHYRMLRAAFDHAKDPTKAAIPANATAERFKTYPTTFDVYVGETYDHLLALRAALTGEESP